MISMEHKKVGLVLSGGGVKGMSHIGVLKALQEFNIEPVVISGASAGAIVGALYAQGSGIDDMLAFFKETPLFKYNFFALRKPGLFDTEKYLTILDDYMDATTFEDLKKSLTVVATNLESGTPQYFNTGELLRPVLASAALPPVFSPVKIEQTLYADGGIMDNFPINCIKNQCDILLGSYTSTGQTVSHSAINNSIKLMTRVNNLMLHANVMHQLSLCDILFQPNGLEDIAILDKKGIGKAFNIGYETAMNYLGSKGGFSLN